MDKVVENRQVLHSFANNLFKEFANGIEQNNGTISLRRIIKLFVGFGNNDSCRLFEMQRLMT